MDRKLKAHPTPERLRQRARWHVEKAMREGTLPRLSQKNIKCTDCGERAVNYDHRDYCKPLEVEPVCRKCNNTRGPGLPWPDGYKGKARREQPNGHRWGGLSGSDEEEVIFPFPLHVSFDFTKHEQHEDFESVFKHDADVLVGQKELNKYPVVFSDGKRFYKKTKSFFMNDHIIFLKRNNARQPWEFDTKSSIYR